ncbi:hypothetical protein niasHS_014661 [Heterodera schachtii]|uniref:Uncharacterized protein n=1 Tax=Heterodera schachtii TaxID=97005 RepID=A0ABD2IFI4_HETSC
MANLSDSPSSSFLFFFFLLLLFLLCLSAQLPSSQPRWQCPNNGTYFDATPCDPNAAFSCPALYKCRMAVERDGEESKAEEMKAGKRVQWICCESAGMGIREWLLELGLAPAVFPKVPDSTLRRVFLRDEQSGKVIAVDGNGADVSLLPFDSSESANYSRLEGIEFGEGLPKNGGFLHFLVAINQLSSPSALQLYFDYSSFGIAQIDLEAQNDRFPRGFAQAIGSDFVPADLAYRRQNVLAVFHTDVPMANLSQEIDRQMADSDGKLQKAMFGSNGGMAKLLGATPIAGFIYTITTRASIFPLTYDQRWRKAEQSEVQAPQKTEETAQGTKNETAKSAKRGTMDQLEYNAGGIGTVATEKNDETTAVASADTQRGTPLRAISMIMPAIVAILNHLQRNLPNMKH